MSTALGKLSARQLKFVQAIIVGRNLTEAAIASGSTPKSASAHGWRFNNSPKVQAALAELRMKSLDEAVVTVKRTLEELVVIGFSDIRHYEQDPNDLRKLRLTAGAPDSAMRAVSGVKFKTLADGSTEMEYKLWSKSDALQLIARHLGMLVDKVQVDAGDSLATMVLEAARLRTAK